MLYPALKRCFDLVMAGLGLLLLLCLPLLLGHVMRLLDVSLVSFTRVVIGWLGHPFRIHEFVSVVFGADKLDTSFTKEGGDLRMHSICRLLFAV